MQQGSKIRATFVRNANLRLWDSDNHLHTLSHRPRLLSRRFSFIILAVLRRHVLIFHQAALGDFIVTWPLAVALGRMFAQSRISYVTHASKGQLAGRVIGVEAIDVEHGWHLLHAEHGELSEANRKTLASAHLIVSFVSNPGDAWEQNIARLAPEAKLIRLRTRPVDDTPARDPELPETLQNHITAVLLAQLGGSPVVAAGLRQILRSVMTRGLPIGGVQQAGVAIHPGAGKAEKCWPVERFIALAERLKEKQIPVRILLGQAEIEKWPASAIEKISLAGDVQCPATLLDLLQAIASGSAFVGNDSGPAHLAGIIGLPTVSLFATDPARWRPLGPRVGVVRSDSMDQISVDEVEAVLNSIASITPLNG